MKRIFLGSLGIGTLGFILFAIPLLDAQQQGPPGGFPPPPVLQAIDKDGDGTISEQELAQAPAALRSIDKNSDGKLAGDEIIPDFGPGFGGPGFGGPGFGGPGGPGGANRQLLEKFDKDGDGILNTAEREAARAEAGSGGGGFGGPGGPGFGGPGGGRGGRGGGPGGMREPAKTGDKVAVDSVEEYPSADLYDTSVLRTLFINFENEKWEEELAAFNNTDVEVPAKLLVDGKTYENVGVHFRGMSSYMMVPATYKRSLNLTMDFVDKDQRLYGYKTLNLLNANGDASYLSSVLYSHIARKFIAAPKANFMRVVINGENWGVYVNVQQFNKDFTEENFGSTKGARWKVSGSPNGDGGLRYLGDNVEEYRRRFQIKSSDDDKSWKALIELCRVLKETPADSLEAELSKILDIDGALRFLALDCSLVNSDGYWTRASDYSLYLDDDQKFHIIPHDMNEAFHGATGGRGPGGPGGRGGRGGRGGGPGGAGGPEQGPPQGPPPGERPEGGRPEGGRPEGGPEGPGGFGFPGFGGPGFGGPGFDGPGFGGPGFGGPGGPGFGGPGGGRGPGGMNEGNYQLDPLIGLDDERKPLRSKLLAVPALRAKYLSYVRAIAEESLTWRELGPIIVDARKLLDKHVAADTHKLLTHVEFLAATNPEPLEGDARMSLRSFIEKRSEFLLKDPKVAEVTAAKLAARQPITKPKVELNLKGDTRPANSGLVMINEVLAGNTKSAKDDEGEFEDYIELYNPTDAAVDLSKMYLSDNEQSPTKWQFPAGTTIAPKSYLVIWADEDSKTSSGLHTNFKLSSKGETVLLAQALPQGLAIVDFIKFGAQTNDVAYGRKPKELSQLQALVPTPGAANRLGE